MALTRRVETFIAAYVGLNSEATALTDAAMTDMDNPAARQNWAITNRAQQYWKFNGVVSVKTGTIVGSAATADPTTYTVQPLGGIIRFNTPLASGNFAWVTCSYIPMYFLRGARNVGNTSTAAKIDTTGSGDTYMSGVPGRPDANASFSIVTGPKVVNKATKTVTLESMLVGARASGDVCVFAFQDDVTDPLLPRDVLYGFVGNANKTRPLNGAIERAIEAYLAVQDDGSLPLVSIDYIA